MDKKTQLNVIILTAEVLRQSNCNMSQQQRQSNSYNSMIALMPTSMPTSPASTIIGHGQEADRRYTLTMRRPLESHTRPLENALLRDSERSSEHIQSLTRNNENHNHRDMMRRPDRMRFRFPSEQNNGDESLTGQGADSEDLDDFFLDLPRHSRDYYLLTVPKLSW